jgi:hypothetical protein
VLREDGGQIRDQTIFAERGKDRDEREDPVGRSAQRGRDGHPCGPIVGADDHRFRPVAHQHRGQREAEKGNAAQHEKGIAPSVMRDHPLGERRYHDRADSAASEQQRQSEPSILREPGQHGARIRELRSSVRHQSKHEESEKELPDVRSEPAEGSQRKSETHDGRQDDAARREAVEQEADGGRDEGYGDGSQRKSPAHRFPLPTERGMQGIEKQAERVWNDGSKADHDAGEGAGENAPPGVMN